MPHQSAAAIRERIDHPIIDADGHCLEYMPLVREYLREAGGQRVDNGFWGTFEGARAMAHATNEQRRDFGVIRPPWWAFPASNTLDRATAMLPKLLYGRLDEIGLDFAVVYPTYGLIIFNIADEEVRRGAARGFNSFLHDAYAEFADRLTPVAIIPMHSPEEAIAELDFACGELGFKAVLLAGHTMRDVRAAGETPRAMQWMDTYGWDSPHDYDPVWRRCVELGVSPTFHSSGMGWGSRMSPSSYVYNHIGNFAAGGEASCRALFLDGVPVRFPELRFAFLEGGVAWASTLYSDILGHYEKRNGVSVRIYDHTKVHRSELLALFEAHGSERALAHIDQMDEALWPFSDPGGDDNTLDEFERSGITSTEDVRDIFARNFFFGCEADDPSNATAFDTRRNPMGARLNAVFSSDVGHWDVPDNREVLGEAWELVDDGLIDTDDFRRFTFTNPAALYTGTNENFFKDTSVEASVAALKQV
jgi:predicted TIM-barrel fold metal-dependent hydrolase